MSGGFYGRVGCYAEWPGGPGRLADAGLYELFPRQRGLQQPRLTAEADFIGRGICQEIAGNKIALGHCGISKGEL